MDYKYTVDEFIVHHNSKYRNYCEAIILPDGRIIYSVPSHIQKLQMLWGVPEGELYYGGEIRDELWERIPQSASPVHWLSEDLNCVVLWYNFIIFPPSYTAAQMNCVNKLIKHGCIASNPMIQVTVEKDICDPITREDLTKVESIVQHQQSVLNKIKSELEPYNL